MRDRDTLIAITDPLTNWIGLGHMYDADDDGHPMSTRWHSPKRLELMQLLNGDL